MDGWISKISLPFITLKFRQNIAEENQQIIRKQQYLELQTIYAYEGCSAKMTCLVFDFSNTSDFVNRNVGSENTESVN